MRTSVLLGNRPRLPAAVLSSWLALAFANCIAEDKLLFGGKVAQSESGGPLIVHPKNPRYFTDGSGQAIYLTGSHTWAQWTEGFDYGAYLDFLQNYNHNFIRLWSGDYFVGVSPSPYVRTGPGMAVDGGLKANLDQFNQAYFDRLRSCAVEARDRGIYVAITFFPVGNVRRTRDWNLCFFNSSNNVQGINGDTNGDGHGIEAYTLGYQVRSGSGRDTRLMGYQEAFARKVIDTVNDLDNVLYEIGNEGDVSSIQWQYHLVRYIKDYEAGKAKQHPVGMTAVFDWLGSRRGNNAALFKSPAEWISPGLAPYEDNPPAGKGRKVIIADVDHIWPREPQPAWIWKCFVRGLHPIHMDWYTFGPPPTRTGISSADQEAMRRNMGYTLTYAQKMNLAVMTPRNSISSTRYCLANPGSEYLVYQPVSQAAFTVKLSPGIYTYEWFNPQVGAVAETGSLAAAGSKKAFSAPFSGDAVLYLRRSGEESILGLSPHPWSTGQSGPCAGTQNDC